MARTTMAASHGNIKMTTNLGRTGTPNNAKTEIINHGKTKTRSHGRTTKAKMIKPHDTCSHIVSR